jgi:crotonobetainyl-CoA:carnitine CoA-transferase CaiB-like acyl-CoA transferase
LTYGDLVSEDHVIQSGAVASVSHPRLGEIRAPVIPGRFSETPVDLTGPPPSLPGEH